MTATVVITTLLLAAPGGAAGRDVDGPEPPEEAVTDSTTLPPAQRLCGPAMDHACRAESLMNLTRGALDDLSAQLPHGDATLADEAAAAAAKRLVREWDREVCDRIRRAAGVIS